MLVLDRRSTRGVERVWAVGYTLASRIWERLLAQRIVQSYRVLVGMEIHVQLATASKMFTGAANGFGGEPNTQVDEQVLGLPGVLPVMNRRRSNMRSRWAWRWAARSPSTPNGIARAITIRICRRTIRSASTICRSVMSGEFELMRRRRKHSENPHPPGASGGGCRQTAARGARRVSDRLEHRRSEPRRHAAAGDRHRAGFLHAEEVALFGQELQKLVQFLGVSEGQMQMGHMRFEPNINVHITDQDGKVHKTAITEIKNLNSFSVLERATAYEVRRQIRQWEETG